MKSLVTTEERQSIRQDRRTRSPFCVESPRLASSGTHRLALVDAQGYIVAVNKEWMAPAKGSGAVLSSARPGVNYLKVCRRASASSADSAKALRGIQAVLKQKVSSFAMNYWCPTSAGAAYFRMDVTAIAYRGDIRIAIAHTEVTDRRRPGEMNSKLLQQFALRLIHAQEEERQRISQEMHDDLGNRIALMALSTRQIMKRTSDNSSMRGKALNELFDQITDLAAAVREISQGLHPVLLRHVGINAALKSLKETFESAHGIHIDMAIAEALPPLPDAVALCMFRITQEALQNVAKHSGANRASIGVERTRGGILLTISDTGRGFVRSEAIRRDGLGLLSIEARVLSIKGRLRVNSTPRSGTEVRVSIPLQETVSAITVQ